MIVYLLFYMMVHLVFSVIISPFKISHLFHSTDDTLGWMPLGHFASLELFWSPKMLGLMKKQAPVKEIQRIL